MVREKKNDDNFINSCLFCNLGVRPLINNSIIINIFHVSMLNDIHKDAI